MDLLRLISPTIIHNSEQKDPHSLILRASVLLGRIITHHNDLHSYRNPEQHAAVFSALENALTRFNLVLGNGYFSVLDVPLSTFNYDVWLNILVQQCTILLYHPTVSEADPATGQPSSSQTNGITSVQNSTQDQSAHPHKSALGFTRCINAMRNLTQIIKETASRSLNALLNPFLVPAYFLCCRFLTITWHESQVQSDREDIDSILILFDRVAGFWGPLAAKYRDSILHDLARCPNQAKRLRRGTGSYLSQECAK
jgi:hypothetical protein